MPPAEAFPRCAEAAQQTLELDPKSPEAYSALGYVALYFKWNAAESDAAFRKAIEIDPTYPVASQWYANLLAAEGRFDEAWDQANRAHERDPLALIALVARGWVSYHAGECDKAIDDYNATLEMDSTFALAHIWTAFCLQKQGKPQEAISRAKLGTRLAGDSPFALASQAYLQALTGEKEEAERIVKSLENLRKERYVPAYELGKAHLALGDEESGYRWLNTAREEHSHSMVFLTVDPQLAQWRDQERFRELVRNVSFIRDR